ncbi:uncharacterized protein LOC122024329 [Zingiber officinale]|uniref:uncharacterized protein LOC122024329 n=1 Tax=Zingiber officinale TaxID=94328 RepID=UPI001C4C3016|nr:uncharacterized protein LOC122024329 [Zingiber officinale]
MFLCCDYWTAIISRPAGRGYVSDYVCCVQPWGCHYFPACVPILFPGLRADLISRPVCRSYFLACAPISFPSLCADLGSRPTCRYRILVCVLVPYPGLRAGTLSRFVCQCFIPVCVPVLYPDLQFVFRVRASFSFSSSDPALHPDRTSPTLPDPNKSSRVPSEGAPLDQDLPRASGYRGPGQPSRWLQVALTRGLPKTWSTREPSQHTPPSGTSRLSQRSRHLTRRSI